ncbi:response regulator [Pseudomonas sp. PB3P13]
MPTKTLRILIADEQHFHRMRIERLFNQLGYFCIAPVHDLDELLTLVEYASEPFDLVLMNGAMTRASIDPLDFFIDNPQVNHAFIYDSDRVRLPSIPAGACRTVQLSPAALPDLCTVRQLMAGVDQVSPFVGSVVSIG